MNNLTEEDVNFLKDLQHELNTQDREGTREPVYWGIVEKEDVIVQDICDSDEVHFYLPSEGESYTLKDIIEYINDLKEDDEVLEKDWEYVDKDNVDEIEDFVREYIDDGCDVYYTCEEYKLSKQTGAFLTKRAAIKYIENFGYNHNDPKTYCMHAFRNFELEKLINIIKKINIDDLSKSK